MDDAQPSSNIYKNSWGSNPVAGMDLPELCKNKDNEIEIYGTEYTLAYFGKDHNQPATYKFPKGVHIAFFIGNQSLSKTDVFN